MFRQELAGKLGNDIESRQGSWASGWPNTDREAGRHTRS